MTAEQTATAILVFVIEITATVVGQLLLKRAMDPSHPDGFGNARTKGFFIGGIVSLTISFFLTIGLLEHFDLSKFYPIQGLTVVIITLAAAIFLREKLSPQLILGAILISIGIFVVSLS